MPDKQTAKQWQWWEIGTIYQIYPRSFNDTTGNGIGDLQGIIEKLDYLNDGTPDSLGVDAIWISPFYPSPMKDFGYDVADYTDVNPLFGDLATFDKLVTEAHKRNIKIIIDWVPNHSSDEHAWFKESRSSRDNPKADWYIWRDAKPDGSPPNNWGSVFGGKAWTWDETRQQYYFHQFDPGQPDLNWRNPEVKQAMHDTLRFWFERGVDGFRMDVVYMIAKHPDMPDQPVVHEGRGDNDIFGRQEQIYSFNYDGVHDYMREFRQIADAYNERVLIGEIWLSLEERMKFYGEQLDELHLPFNFDLIAGTDFKTQGWDAERIIQAVNDYEAQVPNSAMPNYVLGSHDVTRLASRVGEVQTRVAAMLLLTLRGVPTLYMGDEIGMLNGEITADNVQDPQGLRLGLTQTRDYCRTPIQWDDSDYAGFSEVAPWLPVHSAYKTHNIAVQCQNPDSLLNLYKRLLWLRKATPALHRGSYTYQPSSDNTFVYMREAEGERYLIALNMGNDETQIDLPTSGRTVLHTHKIETNDVDEQLALGANEGVIVHLDYA
jgi:alpha-glucosidase